MEREREVNNAKRRWAYSNRVDPERQKLLLAAPDFECIATSIADEMKIIDFKICAGYRPEVKGCHRAEFKLRVEKTTFDLFFNSRFGYRGQYHQNPSDGESANAALISQICSKLIAHVEGHVDLTRIERSLMCISAKIWINEGGIRKERADIALIEELLVEPWLSAARKFKSDPQSYCDEIKALDGIRAPTGSILEVKGGFIDASNHEHIAEDKENRSQHIHLYGFS